MCLPLFSSAALGSGATGLSLKAFHEKASRKEPVDVAFFGGSLTWGAESSDPQTVSYRGLMMQWLRNRYPETAITFHDAAIGGTGSQLGLFRLERDVLRHKPDLVFLDFTVNDGFNRTDIQNLAAYEQLIREMLTCDVMVMPVLLMFKEHADDTPKAPLPPRHRDHIKIADAYQLPVANVLPYVRTKVAEGADIDTLWPFGGSHPDDPGYRLFFEAVSRRYDQALTEALNASIPETPLYGGRYSSRTREVLVDEPLPQGWTRAKTHRTALWFDGLSSRWMGDVARATADAQATALEVEFHGSMVGIFGEHDGLTPPIRVWIDGKQIKDLWTLDTSRFAPPKKGTGNLFLWKLLADDLEDGPHTLRIEPVWDNAHPDADLRIESICSAGR